MMTKMSTEVLEEFTVPHCVPMVYSFNEKMEPLNYQFLGDQNEIIYKIDRIRDEEIEPD